MPQYHFLIDIYSLHTYEVPSEKIDIWPFNKSRRIHHKVEADSYKYAPVNSHHRGVYE
jgi:hypothetical protein